MKILSIAAGAAGMYCGSCLRDNALAAELIRRGHDVILLPLYTPLRTDEHNVSRKRVFFGGISIYLQLQSALFRRTPRFLDRLWDSHWALKLASRGSIPTSPRMLGELTVSALEGVAGIHAKEIDKLVAWLRNEPAPDVVNLPNSLLIGLAEPLKRALRRPVACTLQGEDLFVEGLPEPYRSRALALIRRSVDHVDAFLPVSETYAGHMSRYLEIPAEKMHVVSLGVNVSDFSSAGRPRPDGPFTIGYLARIAPEKGLGVLVDAFLHLRKHTDFDGVLRAAGYLPLEHREHLQSLVSKVQRAGLGSGFSYLGEVDRPGKVAFMQDVDVFSVPCTYQEPKGLSVLEAMASGVPAVQPHVGAFPEMLRRTGGGLLVNSDTASLAAGIYELWRDRERCASLGRAGAAGVRQHYSLAAMADSAMQVYTRLAEGEPARLSLR